MALGMETQSDTSATLLETFRRECDAKFAFLEKAHSARKEFGLSRGNAPIASLDAYHADQLSGFFLAVQRYRLKRTVIEIVYDDRDSIVGARVFFPVSGGFGLFEILRAAGIQDPDAEDGGGISSKDAMQRTISSLAGVIDRRFALVTNPGFRIVGRAQEIRREQIRRERETHRRAFLQRARNDAAIEFRKRNYRKVVELLSPFEDMLSEADRKKVEIARERAASGQ